MPVRWTGEQFGAAGVELAIGPCADLYEAWRIKVFVSEDRDLQVAVPKVSLEEASLQLQAMTTFG